jgi:3-phenylpropionate/trans-cinnamate dioxygenase ferredoxin reductase subunit
MEYVGPAYDWSEEIVRGSVDEAKFTVYYLDGDRLAAALSVDRGDDLDRARELIASREPVDRDELRGD